MAKHNYQPEGPAAVALGVCAIIFASCWVMVELVKWAL